MKQVTLNLDQLTKGQIDELIEAKQKQDRLVLEKNKLESIIETFSNGEVELGTLIFNTKGGDSEWVQIGHKDKELQGYILKCMKEKLKALA